MRTPRLPVADWTDATADLNGLVRFAERRNLVYARVPSNFNWPRPFYHTTWSLKKKIPQNLGTYYEYCAWSWKRNVVRACPSVWIFKHYNTERTACVVVQLFGKRNYIPRSILYYSGRVFLILTPFSLIKSVKKFRSIGSSTLKSCQHIYGGSVVKTVQSVHTKYFK